jgi:rare lipoprotein A
LSSSSNVRPLAPERPSAGAAARAELARPQTSGKPSRAARVTQRVRKRSAAAVGYATYYARMFDGRTTASGVPFDVDAMVAAHPSYPFGTLLRVTNLRNGSSTRVRIVDRGPARGPRCSGVIIDLSPAAAKSLGMIRAGRAPVRVEVVAAE